MSTMALCDLQNISGFWSSPRAPQLTARPSSASSISFPSSSFQPFPSFLNQLFSQRAGAFIPGRPVQPVWWSSFCLLNLFQLFLKVGISYEGASHVIWTEGSSSLLWVRWYICTWRRCWLQRWWTRWLPTPWPPCTPPSPPPSSQWCSPLQEPGSQVFFWYYPLILDLLQIATDERQWKGGIQNFCRRGHQSEAIFQMWKKSTGAVHDGQQALPPSLQRRPRLRPKTHSVLKEAVPSTTSPSSALSLI